jgi:tetratricopeptide (TPR) repeat protein
MYLRGSKWNMSRRRRQRANPWRVLILLALIGVALYVNQVVVPATPPLFIPTPTPTRDPESFINEAEELFNSGKISQSIPGYETAIRANPDNPALYLALAKAQIYSGKFEDALESAERALILNSNNPTAHAYKAWALDFLADFTQAEASVKEALTLDPDSALAHAVYAEILIDKSLAGQGDINVIDKAAAESRAALELDPTLMEARRARGYVLWNTGNFEEAVQEYEAALAINDRVADLHMGLGHNQHLLGNYDLAVQAYLQAYALNPTDPKAPYEISRTYSTVGDFTQAVQYADQAVKSDPQNPRMHGNLGVMYYKNNQLEEGVRELGLAIRGGTMEDGTTVEGLPLNYGTVAEYYAIYGLALAKLNRCNEAVPIFQAIRSGVPDDEINVYNAEQGLIICQSGIEETQPGEEDETGDEAQPETTESPESQP